MHSTHFIMSIKCIDVSNLCKNLKGTIILFTCFDGLYYIFWPHLIHIHLLEGGLKQLEVVNVFMLQFGVKFHSLEGNKT